MSENTENNQSLTQNNENQENPLKIVIENNSKKTKEGESKEILDSFCEGAKAQKIDFNSNEYAIVNVGEIRKVIHAALCWGILRTISLDKQSDRTNLFRESLSSSNLSDDIFGSISTIVKFTSENIKTFPVEDKNNYKDLISGLLLKFTLEHRNTGLFAKGNIGENETIFADKEVKKYKDIAYSNEFSGLYGDKETSEEVLKENEKELENLLS